MKKILACYLAIGFILNFIWEIAQAGLYEPHFQGIFDFMSVHLKATFGDIIMLLVIYVIAGLFYWDGRWIEKRKVGSYVVVALLGFVLAVIVEGYALMTGRWKYSEIMPIIPYIKVGLIPALQLTILTPLSAFIARRYAASQMK